MRLILIHHLLAVCFTQVLASRSPYCRTGSNGVALDPSPAGPQKGSMSYLKFGIKRAWPLVSVPGKGKLRLIRYCFANAQAKAELDCPLQKGFNIWAEAIKAPPSAENGHSLGWKEIHDETPEENGREHPFCYLDDYKSKKEPGTWNPKVNTDVLAIHLGVADEAPYASVGYDASEQDPGRHFLVMGSSDTEAHRVAHEIGHILGMIHEQCRFDRDDYVLFRCDKLVGYQEALIAASIAGNPDAAEKLCNSQEFANRFGFEAGAQYIKNDAHSDLDSPIMDEGPFDYGSIMIYPSNAYAADSACWEQGDLSACPLVAAKFGATWSIATNVAVSRYDIEFVKRWYKWEEEAPATGTVKQVRDDERKRNVVRVHRILVRGNDTVVKH